MKFVNNKGAPIVRKANEPGQRRHLEADDVLHMIMLLDVHKVELPKFVAEDLDRVPRDIVTADSTTDSPLAEVDKLVANVNQVLSQFTATMDTIIQRLDGVEAKLATPFTSMSEAVLQRLDDTAATTPQRFYGPFSNDSMTLRRRYHLCQHYQV